MSDTYVRFVGLKVCKNCDQAKPMKETDPPGTFYIRCCGELQVERGRSPGLHLEVHR